MNALDRAFIKAYAKTTKHAETNSESTHVEAPANAVGQPPRNQPAPPIEIEHSTGAWSRIDHPHADDVFSDHEAIANEPQSFVVMPEFQPEALTPDKPYVAIRVDDSHDQLNAAHIHVIVENSLDDMPEIDEQPPEASDVVIEKEKAGNRHDEPAEPMKSAFAENEESSLGDESLHVENSATVFGGNGSVESERQTENKSTPILAEFKPAWEVDHFIWPTICERLYQHQHQYFHEAGSRLRAAAQEGLNVLGLTSAVPGTGKTTMAICLARAAIQRGVQVALVDADFNNPHLRIALGLESVCGWEKAVQEKLPLSECAIQSSQDGLTIVPLSGAAKHVSMWNPPEEFAECLRRIAEHFDLVIVDMGTSSDRSSGLYDLGKLSPVNAVIVVRDVRHDDVAASSVVAQVKQSGIEAVGFADNFYTLAQDARASA